jgi:hypothetical protein
VDGRPLSGLHRRIENAHAVVLEQNLVMVRRCDHRIEGMAGHG